MARRGDKAKHREYNRIYNAAHREKRAEYQRKWYARHPHVRRVFEAREQPCVDCGIELPPMIMEMDHVRGEKEFSLAQARLTSRDITAERLEAEIAKCDVRCPNCHRMRHYLERPWNQQEVAA